MYFTAFKTKKVREVNLFLTKKFVREIYFSPSKYTPLYISNGKGFFKRKR